MGDALAHSDRARRRRRLSAQAALRGRRLLRRAAGRARHGARAQRRRELREDAVIGLVFTSFFAAGPAARLDQPDLGQRAVDRARQHPRHLRRGRHPGRRSSPSSRWRVLLLKWKDLMLVFFDESHARSVGLNPDRAQGPVLHAARRRHVVAALQTVGACLVIAMVVTPGATAYLLTDRFPRLLVARRRHRRRDELRRRLCQLLPRRRDRRRDRRAADAAVPRRLRLRAQARPAGRAPQVGRGWPCRGGCAMSALLDFVIVPLSYDFMQRALVVAVLVGAVCAVLSCFLVLKGWSLMGDAISHAVLPGIVIAFVLGLPLAIGAFAAGPRLRRGDRLPQGEQPREGGHGDGHRVLRHVRLRPRAVHQGRDRPAPQPHPVRQHARRDRARSRRDRRSSPAARC